MALQFCFKQLFCIRLLRPFASLLSFAKYLLNVNNCFSLLRIALKDNLELNNLSFNFSARKIKFSLRCKKLFLACHFFNSALISSAFLAVMFVHGFKGNIFSTLNRVAKCLLVQLIRLNKFLYSLFIMMLPVEI